MTAHVWYAAYGSNCDDDRFACYLRGGRPRGSTRDHVGCRDTTAPTATTVLDLPHALYFGGWSPYWRGAVAFLDPMPDPDVRTFAVARRITVEQFADVVAQECGDDELGRVVSLEAVASHGRHDLEGHYGTVLGLGQHEGEPVVTCTSAVAREVGDPAPAYLDTIRRGLGRFHAPDVLDPYLAGLSRVSQTVGA
ncbi:histone deacetylase [Salsipaludibacter albus]|uniref:histone deacetylase n=1 Tax=Salsipaludibacter albus TaxID=2849650 RepID=UPI001EE485E0|nr:histone deacetylase [Salsipaludibacter albus]MBY5161500.1 histone deacetylase [Salsipaludibacter albus]